MAARAGFIDAVVVDNDHHAIEFRLDVLGRGDVVGHIHVFALRTDEAFVQGVQDDTFHRHVGGGGQLLT